MNDEFERLLRREQAKRAKTQMTLGGLRKALENMDPDDEVIGIGNHCFSYRGYYMDVAFDSEPMCSHLVRDLLVTVRGAFGGPFRGYKGGEYFYDKNTPVWLACYGDTGRRLVGFTHNGEEWEAVTEEERG